MKTILQFFADVWQIHSGILSAFFIVFCLAVIGWASDEWENTKSKH